jgi:hypothetical protein
MKYVLPLLLLATSLSAFADVTPASSFRFESREYSLQRLGRTLWVTPARIDVKAVIAQGNPPDCAEYEARLAKLKNAIKTCSNEKSSYCDMMAKSVYIMAENRAGGGDAPDLTQGKANFWKVAEVSPSIDRAALTAAAAKQAGVSESAVRLNLDPRAKLKSAPAARFDEGSFVKRVEGFVKFGANELGAWNNQGLVTRNALAACDILAGRVHFTGPAESSLTSTDLTPDVVIDTAWKAYEAIARAPALDLSLSPLAQAHKVGFYLGREMPELAEPADPLLDVTEVFNRFFEQRSFGLKLKEFGSKESMRTQIYPDQTYRASVNHEWSL